MMLKASCSSIGGILRRKIWLPALWFITLFFALPVRMAMCIQHERNFVSNYAGTIANYDLAANMQDTVSQVFSAQSMVLLVLFVVMALVCALVYTNYMHKPRQVDFYHSQPVLRQRLLAYNLLAGLLAFLLPYLLNLLFSVLVVCFMGAGVALQWGVLFGGLGHHLLYFLAIYALCCLASIISGHTAVAALVAVFLLGVLPALFAFAQGVIGLFYNSFYTQLVDWVAWYYWLSPVAAYIVSSAFGYGYWGLPPLIFAAAVFACCFVLYRKRPSEAAGQAIAFRAAKPILKYAMALLAALVGSFVFYSIGVHNFWWYFGAVCGALLACQITEIVYHFDFKAIGRHWGGALIFLIIFLLGSTVWLQDLTGFNRYVPDEGQVASAEVYFPSLNDYVYGNSFSGYAYAYYSSSSFVSIGQPGSGSRNISEQDRLAQGPVTTPEGLAAVCELARIYSGQYLKAARADTIYDGSDGLAAYFAEGPDLSGQEYLRGYLEGVGSYNLNTTAFRVVFTLQNGAKVARSYYVELPVQLLLPQIKAIYGAADFREAQLAFFDQPAERIGLATIQAFELPYQPSTPAVTAAQKEKLLTALRQDLAGLTVEQQEQSMPVGALGFRLYPWVEDEGIGWQQDITPYTSWELPVYASFSATLGVLEELGFAPDVWQPQLSSIQRLMIYDYRQEEWYQSSYGLSYTIPESQYETVDEYYPPGSTSTLVDDPAEQARIIQESYPDAAARYNFFIDLNRGLEIEITYQPQNNQRAVLYRYYPQHFVESGGDTGPTD